MPRDRTVTAFDHDPLRAIQYAQDQANQTGKRHAVFFWGRYVVLPVQPEGRVTAALEVCRPVRKP